MSLFLPHPSNFKGVPRSQGPGEKICWDPPTSVLEFLQLDLTFLGVQNVVRFHMSGNTIKFEFWGWFSLEFLE